MCFVKNKWQPFTPTKEYLDVVKELTSIKKLHEFLKKYTWIKEIKDYWKTPYEFMLESGDCEDFAIFAIDVLVRIIKIDEARFVFCNGYDYERWGNEKHGHAICVFPYREKLAQFSNSSFHSGFDSYEEAGHYTFPDGLKYIEIRDWQGKILEKKHSWFGTF